MQQRKYRNALLILLALFCCRVLGQALVAFFNVPFLPPMDEWFSGFLPYPQLLSCQICIILLYGKVCIDFARGRGYFVEPKPRLSAFLLRFGSIYLTVMIARYAIRMGLYPAERWTGGSIPIFFHWVLATFLLVLGAYHRSVVHRLRSTVDQVSTTTLPESPRKTSKALSRLANFAVALCLITAGIFWIAWQLFPSIVAHQLGLRPAVYAVRLQQHVQLLLTDGVTLNADVFHPVHCDRTPTILIRIPLSVSLKNSFYENLMGRLWAERGYTVVVQGTRGRFGSGASYYPLKNERKDGLETLNWLSKQRWFNGQIATWGGSAFGYTEFAICDQENPGPSVLQVYESTSNFYDMFYPGGAFSLSSALCWALNSQGKEDRNDWPSAREINIGVNGFPEVDADRRSVGQVIPFFRDWALHNQRDSYWFNLDATKYTEKIKSPILLICGWYDPFLPAELNDYARIKSSSVTSTIRRTRLIIGPWAHASEVMFPDGSRSEQFRPFSLATSLPWFDDVLGVDSAQHGNDKGPVRIFVVGKNIWRSENEWPLTRTQYTPFYLDSAGTANSASGTGRLSKTISAGSCLQDQYIYSPLDPVPTAGGPIIGSTAGIACQNTIESRMDVLVYTSDGVETDTEVTGPIEAVLYINTSSKCTDFTAKLVDVYPDGRAFNVCDGILRRRYKPLTNTLDKARRGCSPEEIKIELWPASIVFRRGHHIRLEISSSNFPRFDRNPNTGNSIPTETRTIAATQIVYHGGKYPSRLILPIIPASPSSTAL